MLIDCESCRVRDVGCSDCVISLFLRGGTGDRAYPADSMSPPHDSSAGSAVLDLDEAERRALDVLADGGLAPPLRLVPVHRHESDGTGPVAAAG